MVQNNWGINAINRINLLKYCVGTPNRFLDSRSNISDNLSCVAFGIHTVSLNAFELMCNGKWQYITFQTHSVVPAWHFGSYFICADAQYQRRSLEISRKTLWDNHVYKFFRSIRCVYVPTQSNRPRGKRNAKLSCHRYFWQLRRFLQIKGISWNDVLLVYMKRLTDKTYECNRAISQCSLFQKHYYVISFCL